MKISNKYVVIVGMIVVAVICGASATFGQEATVLGCVKAGTGQLRIVFGEDAQCKNNETPLAFENLPKLVMLQNKVAALEEAKEALTQSLVGSVVAYAGPTAPDGWLLCDGTAVSSQDFPDLFAVIGNAHGDGDDNEGPLFNLPDYRGRFLRGVDGEANRDPDVEERDSMNPGGNSKNNVGSVQNFATALPEIPFKTNDETLRLTTGTPVNIGGGSGWKQTTITGTISGGDAETRPVNVYVNWIIKY
jgi:hypothetical protein